jgi:hypothetical protein
MSARSFDRKFSVQPYDWNVYFFTDRQAWARFTARRKFGTLKQRMEEAESSVGICSCDIERQQAYVGVFDGSAGTLAHEISHTALRILGSAGVRFTADNNEAVAYLIGHMVERCTA